jgi:ureidoacrylate peracid hydrolase
MHKSQISKTALDRRRRVYGDSECFPLAAGKFAHVVIDLQNAFLSAGSAFAEPKINLVVPNVNKLSDAVRRAGGLNVFIRFTYDPNWTNHYVRFTPEFAGMVKESFAEGSRDHALSSNLDIHSQDLILNKTRISAFTPGTCSLDLELTNRGIDTLVVTGCFSNSCCESTIRDAVQMNYKVVFVEDGNAASSDDDHNGAIADLFTIFGCDVRTTEAIVNSLLSCATCQST